MKSRMEVKTGCAVILSAGFGERFKPLSLKVPKPAIPFLNKPMICWLLEQLVDYGVKRVFINLHHLPGKVVQAVLPYKNLIEINFSYEENILGTYGLFSKIKDDLQEKFFVFNSDFFMKLPLKKLDDNFDESFESLLLLKKLRKDDNYTKINLNEGKVENLGEGNHFFCGLYLAKKSFLNLAKKEEKIDLTDVLRKKIQRGLIGGIESKNYFYDIGSKRNYLKATKEVLKLVEKNRVEIGKDDIFFKRGCCRILKNKDSFISDKAKLNGFIVVGKNCEVSKKSNLKNCVLLENIKLDKVYFEDAIIGEK